MTECPVGLSAGCTDGMERVKDLADEGLAIRLRHPPVVTFAAAGQRNAIPHPMSATAPSISTRSSTMPPGGGAGMMAL